MESRLRNRPDIMNSDRMERVARPVRPRPPEPNSGNVRANPITPPAESSRFPTRDKMNNIDTTTSRSTPADSSRFSPRDRMPATNGTQLESRNRSDRNNNDRIPPKPSRILDDPGKKSEDKSEFRMSNLLPSSLRKPKPETYTPRDRSVEARGRDRYGLSTKLGLSSTGSAALATSSSKRDRAKPIPETPAYEPYPSDAPTLRRDVRRNRSPSATPDKSFSSTRQDFDSAPDTSFNTSNPSNSSRRAPLGDASDSDFVTRRRLVGTTLSGDDGTSVYSGDTQTVGTRSVASDNMSESGMLDSVTDALRYTVLRSSDIERYKKELKTLKDKSQQLTGKLSVEIKLKETAAKTLKLPRNEVNPEELREAKESMQRSTERVERIIAELLKHTKRTGDLEKRMLQSTAGTLARALRQLGKLGQDAQASGPDSATRGKITALEAKIKTLAVDIMREQEFAEAKEKLADKYAKQVDGLTVQLEQELEKALNRDRIIASLRTELEETTVKLELLETKHGIEVSPTRASTRSRQKILTDFASDSGVDPDDINAANNNMGVEPNEASLRSTIRELKEEVARTQSRNIVLEAELSSSPDPRSAPDLRRAANSSIREAIIERERAKGELEDERILRRELERKLEDLKMSFKNNKPQTHGDQSDLNVDNVRALRAFYNSEFPAAAARENFSVNTLILEVKNRLQNSNNNVTAVSNVSKEESMQIEKLKTTLETREAEKRALENQLILKSNKVEEVSRELANLKTLMDAKNKEREGIEANSLAMENLKREVETQKGYLRVKTSELESIQQEVATLRKLKEEFEQVKAQEIQAIRVPLQERVDSLTNELDERTQALEKLQETHNKLKISNTDEMQDLIQIHNQKMLKLSNELEEAVTKYDTEVLERKKQVREMDEKMADLQKRYDADMAAYERELSTVQNETDTHSSKVDAFNRQIRLLEDDNLSLKEQLARLSEARDTERTDFEQTIEDLRTKLGDSVGIDVEEYRKLKVEVSSMEEQLAKTFDKFAKREDTLSSELEQLQKREKQLQDDYEGLNKEFERIAMNFTDFDSERKKYEQTIAEQQAEVLKFKAEVEEMAINKIGDDEANPTVVTLRKEFRKIVADIREEYSAKLSTEYEIKTNLERTIRTLKRDRDMEVYHKTSASVQTMSLYTEKPDFSSAVAFVSSSNELNLPSFESVKPKPPEPEPVKTGYFW